MKVMSTPRSVDIAITSRCNLRCKYCSHFSSAGDVDLELSYQDWLAFFEELNLCNVMNVNIGGGEPLFYGHLKEIIEGIVNNRMRYSILTNGTLISNDIASYMASTGRCDGVQVSIDGSSPITHDSFRGKGSFTRAIKGIRILQKYHVPVVARVTIHKQNVYDLESIARLLLDEMGLLTFQSAGAAYLGLCKTNAELVQLSIDERSFAMETMLRLNRQYDGRLSANAGPLADARMWLQMERAYRGKEKSIPGGGYLTGCGGCMVSMTVFADGTMVPCVQMSHIKLGQINKDILKWIWQHHPELKRLRERGSIPLKSIGFCQGCNYIDYCTGGCPALAFATTGMDDQPSPDSCLRMFLQSGGTLPSEELLAAPISR